MPDPVALDPRRLVQAALVPRVGDRDTRMVRLIGGEPPQTIEGGPDGEYVLANNTADAPEYRWLPNESSQ